ncbi:hypothetical protein BGP75_05440 [Motiliproteus sp. MSK22-1]|nr:hypothetical protein BGP75_05440 [Motiliproteus sp. MSK22-1]
MFAARDLKKTINNIRYDIQGQTDGYLENTNANLSRWILNDCLINALDPDQYIPVLFMGMPMNLELQLS